MTAADATIAALASHLRLTPAVVSARQDDSLEALGLDSHGLMRVLLDIEKALGLTTSLELPDEALESPRTLAAGVAAITGR
jgi:acyl carrier protein